MPTEADPPNPDEFEISVFGPGRGECIVIHLGNNEWCVVDSCISRGSSESVASEYLDSFGNDALSKVRLVVATHWHDDHIGGLASLFARAPNAAFCCSMALQSEEFLTLINAAPASIAGRSGVEEFAAVLKELEARGKRAPIFSVENKSLLHLTGSDRSFPISLESLSPSNPTIRDALSEMRRFLPVVGEPQTRIVNQTPNSTSVVIWVTAGGARALLGADLEHTVRVDQGWSAVLACHRDSVPGHLFKVPHHGSPTSDNVGVWSRMLENNPIAVVTPLSLGRVRLPQESDMRRLSLRTTRLYGTAAGLGRPPSREPLVEREMKRQLSSRRIIAGQPGHVRVRWANGGNDPAVVERFNGAYHSRDA